MNALTYDRLAPRRVLQHGNRLTVPVAMMDGRNSMIDQVTGPDSSILSAVPPVDRPKIKTLLARARHGSAFARSDAMTNLNALGGGYRSRAYGTRSAEEREFFNVAADKVAGAVAALYVIQHGAA